MKKSVSLALLALMAIPSMAVAQAGNVSLNTEAFVVREVKDDKGNLKRTLVPSAQSRIVPGDALVYISKWSNGTASAITNLVVNNPVPSAVIYTGGPNPAPVVSVDKGKTFGPLATLKVRNADGTMRPAGFEDVTHLRWTIASAPAGQSGQVAYYAKVK